MAKRKLYGAAAAAHAKKVARTRGSTALVRRSPSAVTHTRTRTVVVQAKRRRRSGGGGAGRGVVGALKALAPELIASSLYAFCTQAMTPTALKVRMYLSQLPTLDAIGKPASHGLLALFGASMTSGKLRKGLDLGATAALHRAAANLGTVSFNFEQAVTMGADGDVTMLSGEVDGDVLEGELADDEVGDDDEMGDGNDDGPTDGG